MGYLAITSNMENLIIEKTSETMIVENKSVYTFFEIEISIEGQDVIQSCNPTLTIILPGKTYYVSDAQKIIDDTRFIPWYYSQKSITAAGPGRTIKMNEKHTRILPCSVSSCFDKANNITNIAVTIDFKEVKERPVNTLHTFFCIESRGSVKKQGGNLFAESRYFDKKLCPKGDHFENFLLESNVAKIKRIYCWLIAPKGFFTNDYANFGRYCPRDIRIIEKEYKVLMNGRSPYKRLRNIFLDSIYGLPQVINWVIKEDAISFNDNYKDIGKWDEIRLFVLCSGFPSGTLFLLVSGIASIIGTITGILFSLLKL